MSEEDGKEQPDDAHTAAKADGGLADWADLATGLMTRYPGVLRDLDD